MLSAATLIGAWLLPLENRLVYLPSRSLVATPEDYGLPYKRLMLTAQDGVRLMAWEMPRGEDAPWLIYFHGNGENISRYLPLTSRLHGLGFNVLMLEYRGYGESEGEPGEQGLYLDAMAAYRYLRGRGVPSEEIILYGYSLGTGVAVEIASKADVGALILEAPYTSIPAVARAAYRIIPERLVQNRFASIEKIARVGAPVLIIHAKDDLTVPFGQGLELYRQANEPKQFVEVGGGHIAMLTGDPPQAGLEGIRSFIRAHLQSSNHPPLSRGAWQDV